MTNYKGKLIHNQEFGVFLESNCNLMRIAVNGFEDILKYLHADLEKLKDTPLKPDARTALALLAYFKLNDPATEKIVQTLCGSELQRYFDWLDATAAKHNSSRIQILEKILNNDL